MTCVFKHTRTCWWWTYQSYHHHVAAGYSPRCKFHSRLSIYLSIQMLFVCIAWRRYKLVSRFSQWLPSLFFFFFKSSHGRLWERGRSIFLTFLWFSTFLLSFHFPENLGEKKSAPFRWLSSVRQYKRILLSLGRGHFFKKYRWQGIFHEKKPKEQKKYDNKRMQEETENLARIKKNPCK